MYEIATVTSAHVYVVSHNFPQMTHFGYILSVMNFILFVLESHTHHVYDIPSVK